MTSPKNRKGKSKGDLSDNEKKKKKKKKQSELKEISVNKNPSRKGRDNRSINSSSTGKKFKPVLTNTS